MAHESDGFKFPDVSPVKGPSFGAFISVRADSKHVGVSQALVDRLGLEHGDVAVLAFDDEDRPWVGFLEGGVDDAHQYGPKVYVKADSGSSIQSRPFQVQLKRFAADGERRRLYLTPDAEEVDLDGRFQVTLHRLTLDESG